MAWCWVWLDWGGGVKAWSASGMTWRVARWGWVPYRRGGSTRAAEDVGPAHSASSGQAHDERIEGLRVFDYGLEFFEVGEFSGRGCPG